MPQHDIGTDSRLNNSLNASDKFFTVPKHFLLIFGLLVTFFYPVNLFSQQVGNKSEMSPIEWSILNDSSSYYYIDFKRYPPADASLPIGVFDSGTGGLAILNTILNFDGHNNSTQKIGKDNITDFIKEKFIFLADQANMPYGNYYSENKTDLLVEHVLKDAQFLLSNKYYLNGSETKYHNDKEQVKAIVIACNTATAYAKEHIETFISKTGINLKLIGVIDAGAKGTLEVFKKNEDASIGVLATVGTIASKGYENTIVALKDSLRFTGNLKIFNQGGYGLAEAVDGVPDFINMHALSPRNDYKGPSLNNPQFKIDKTLMDIYSFDFNKNKMLCDSKNTDDCQIIQINSADNYVRYHLVSLMEKIRNTSKAPPLKAIVLGCTHYPYLLQDIRRTLKDLYNYKKAGKYIYRPLMAENIKIIDPAENVAIELFNYLQENHLFNSGNGGNQNSEFYISVPNMSNPNTVADSEGRFTYGYKYGRTAGNIQEYVKMVPFSRNNIPAETIDRLKSIVPATFGLIKSFELTNPKLKQQDFSAKIIE
jgi:glutamate racemase